MGKADILTKEYMQDTIVFADVFNCLIYNGEQVIHPEELHELDTTELATLFGENNKNAQVQVYRDVLKSVTAMEDGEFAYLVLGIENQTGVHYAMPVRNMLYDALQYYEQVKTITRKNSEEKVKRSKDEFLSGITKDDKLLPVITLVVYFGATPWDGPKSLHEMLTGKNAKALDYVADYKLNLLEPATMTDEEIGKLQSELKEVFYFIKYSKDKDKLQELVRNVDDFRGISKSTMELINFTTEGNFKLPDGEERLDMCLAIQQIKEESENKGKLEGKLEGKLLMLFELVKDGLLTISQASTKAKLTEDQFKAEMTKAGF